MDRIFITFEHSSTATSSELEDEQAAAEPLFRAMVKCLREKNVEILSGPFPWDSYGWAVEARSGPTAFTCMMQRSNGWLLQVFQTQSWLQRLLRYKNGSGLTGALRLSQMQCNKRSTYLLLQ